MIKDPLLRDVVAILWPVPEKPPAEADQEFHDQYDTELEMLDEAREAAADRLEAMVDAGNGDVLLAALGDVSYTINRQERLRRLLLAYARQFVPGRGYTLDALAEATGMSPSGIRTAYKKTDVDIVAELIRVGHRPEPGPEAAAEAHLAGLLDRVDQTTRADLLADNGAKLRPLLAGLHAEAADRVLGEVRGRYTHIALSPDLRESEGAAGDPGDLLSIDLTGKRGPVVITKDGATGGEQGGGDGRG